MDSSSPSDKSTKRKKLIRVVSHRSQGGRLDDVAHEAATKTITSTAVRRPVDVSEVASQDELVEVEKVEKWIRGNQERSGKAVKLFGYAADVCLVCDICAGCQRSHT